MARAAWPSFAPQTCKAERPEKSPGRVSCCPAWFLSLLPCPSLGVWRWVCRAPSDHSLRVSTVHTLTSPLQPGLVPRHSAGDPLRQPLHHRPLPASLSSPSHLSVSLTPNAQRRNELKFFHFFLHWAQFSSWKIDLSQCVFSHVSSSVRRLNSTDTDNRSRAGTRAGSPLLELGNC